MNTRENDEWNTSENYKCVENYEYVENYECIESYERSDNTMNENVLKQLYKCCSLCPRRCGVDRYMAQGFCKSGTQPKLAKACLHMWEEPVLGGEKGSGAVFFSGCTLGCVFCQNHDISAEGFGREISVKRLAGIFMELEEKGAQNIDLITAGHYLPSVIAALDIVKHRLSIPIVYNCGGYENVEALRLLDGYIDIYLPDVKYYSDELAVKYSAAPGYYETAVNAVKEMLRQTGRPVFEDRTAVEVSSDGADTKVSIDTEAAGQKIMRKGVIIRHMVLPGCRKDSIALLDALAKEFDTKDFLISLLSQYTPFYKALTEPSFAGIKRRITSFEYDSVVKEALKMGMTGFMQEKSSAKEEYTPSFDLEGII